MDLSAARRPGSGFLGILAALLLPLAAIARADVTYPPRPGQHDFIYDGADLITPADKAAIKAAAEKLLNDEDVAIVIATIPSLAQHGAAGWPIERYAMNLFDEWGVGRQARNYGILLLVSKGDRKARIELGKAYTHERDVRAAQIMNQTIIPRFKRGDFSGGIREGVNALDAMGREQNIPLPARTGTAPGAPPPSAPTTSHRPVAPSPPPSRSPSLLGPLVCIGIAVVGVIIIALLARSRRGGALGGAYGGVGGYQRAGGWGWGNSWGSSVPPWWWWMPGPSNWGRGGLSGDSHSSNRSSSSDSSWSSGGLGGFGGGGFGGGGGGGSFGGGSSGGGGATGSW